MCAMTHSHLCPESFTYEQDVYQKFLQILQRYKEEGFAIQEVKAQVAKVRLFFSPDFFASSFLRDSILYREGGGGHTRSQGAGGKCPSFFPSIFPPPPSSEIHS